MDVPHGEVRVLRGERRGDLDPRRIHRRPLRRRQLPAPQDKVEACSQHTN